MSTYVVPRGSIIPIDFEWRAAGIPVVTATVATATLQDVSGSSYWLDWTDLVMKASPPAGNEILNLTNMADGTYARAGGLSLAAVTMDPGVTILRVTFNGTASGYGSFVDEDNFSLHIGDINIVPAISSTADPFSLLKYGVATTFGKVIQYTPAGESVEQFKAVIDLTPVLVDRNGIEVYLLNPLLKMREDDLSPGILPAKGDTFLAVTSGITYTLAQPPQYDGRGGIKCELV